MQTRCIKEQVKEQAARGVLAALLRRSFGDDPGIEALAERPAALPHEAAVDAILSVASLDERVAAHS